ncbi:MAG: methyltransferase domain-containing protein [Promethearchaeota archaeon]|nr:MAG: methyltransferase domain-containing protein [Candidatus Lokiarchaeota archaeon]
MTSKEAMRPFGLALESYFNGNKDAKIIFHRDDGQQTEDFIKGYFRTYSDFSEHEKIAINESKGKILDIGAGVGPHSLELQKRGFEVLAIDISEKACEIMKDRGLKRVICADPYEIEGENFDTILIMGCSIAFVENLDGLQRFLKYSKTLLNQNGIILMDSRDVRRTDNPEHIKYQDNNIKAGRYRGEIRVKIEYNDILGEMFTILHIDPDKLNLIANNSNWKCKILHKYEDNGLYLAKLS